MESTGPAAPLSNSFPPGSQGQEAAAHVQGVWNGPVSFWACMSSHEAVRAWESGLLPPQSSPIPCKFAPAQIIYLQSFTLMK